ncbi:hypothetical protein LCGC14_1671070, partial [marine sediment metagenome]
PLGNDGVEMVLKKVGKRAKIKKHIFPASFFRLIFTKI